MGVGWGHEAESTGDSGVSLEVRSHGSRVDLIMSETPE